MPKISPKRKRKKAAYLKALRAYDPGRPKEYQHLYAIQVEEIAGLGASLANIAKCFQVTVKVIKEWCAAHPEFLAAIEAGKNNPDNQVEKSLFKRAIAGDVRACMFWLMNRRPHKWRNQHRLPEGEAATDNPTAEQIRALPSDKLRRLLGSGPTEKTIELVPVANPAGLTQT